MIPFREFGETAKGLSRNPIGIIALFLVLIYGLASLVVGFSGHLTSNERIVLVWFLVIFPILVLSVFAWLVGFHHFKLYS
jgi:cytochrome c oxidase subunit IV